MTAMTLKPSGIKMVEIDFQLFGWVSKHREVEEPILRVRLRNLIRIIVVNGR